MNPVKTVKVGDKLQLLKDLDVPNQSDRVVSEITEVSEVDYTFHMVEEELVQILV